MRHSFVVKLAVELGFKALALQLPPLAWLFVGPFSAITKFFAEKFLGFLADRGILAIDLGMDAIKIGLEQKEYRTLIEKAYGKATARVYTEEEKVEIRKQYLEAIRKFATVGNGPKS